MSSVTESTEVTQANSEASTVNPVGIVKVKKDRTEAQKRALDLARQRALTLRAERKRQKTEESKAPVAQLSQTKSVEKYDEEDVEEEIQYVKRERSVPKKKKKRVIIVQQESSSDSEEIEVRLPKQKRREREMSERESQISDREVRFEQAMKQMFS